MDAARGARSIDAGSVETRSAVHTLQRSSHEVIDVTTLT
jgi:hypothetical protein